MKSCSFCDAVALCLACSLSAGAETLDITAAALGINSARVPSVSVLTADVATVTGGVYANTSDGTTSILDITGGTWKSWDPSAGISSRMTIGPFDNAQRTTHDGPVTLRLSGEGTEFVTRDVWANHGTIRLELSDGASWLNTNRFAIAVDSGRVGNGTIVMNDASFRSFGGATSFGNQSWESYYGGDCQGVCSLYVTNSLFYVTGNGTIGWSHGSFVGGTQIFSGSTVTLDEGSDYACSIGSATMLLCDKTTFTARLRLSGSGSLTIDDSSASSPVVTLGTGTSADTAVIRLLSGTFACVSTLTLCGGAQPAWLDLEGGVFKAHTVTGGSGTHAKQPSGKGFARLTGNGTTILCTKGTAISGLDLFEIGARGLTLDLNSYDTTINQDIVNVSGEEGSFLKKGVGVLTLEVPTEYSVSRTTVEVGTLFVSAAAADASVTLATHLAMTNGTILSTVGNAKNLTLGSLDLQGVILKTDPTDTITVTGAASVTNLTMQFSSSPAVDTTNSFLTVKGAISPASILAISNAVVDSAFASGTYGEISAKATAEGLVFTMTIKTAKALGGETRWQGPGAAWTDDANWSAKVPVATNTAVFADADAPAEVNIATAADVGALSFGAGSFTLAGAGPLTLGAPGNSSLAVSAGSHTVDVAVVHGAVTPVALAAGTALTFAKGVTGGGLSKTGTGRLTLAGANAFVGPLSLAAGLTVAEDGGALDGVGTLALGDATLETTAPISLPAGTSLTPAATNAKYPVIVKNEADLTISSVTMGTGVILKRGLGKLTIDTRAGTCATLANNNGDHAGSGGCNYMGNVDFPEDGTPPTQGYGGFTIQEGEVVIKGDNTTPVTFNGSIHIGMKSTASRANPVLTFDGVSATVSGTYVTIHVGIYGIQDNANTKAPTMRILNGAVVNCDQMSLCDQYDSSTRYPTVAVTNSTLSGTKELHFSTIRQGGGRGAILAKNAKLYASTFCVCGTTHSRVSASVLSTSTDGYATFGGDRNVFGDILFDEGTLLKISAFAMTDYMSNYRGSFKFMFDDATWDVGPNDLTINSSNMDQRNPKRFEMCAGGLTLKVASGKTLRTAAPFIGYGPLTLTGGGTLKFDDGAFGLTGTVAVASGTVDFSSVAAVSNNVIRGAGTVSGAAFKEGITLDPQIASDWTVGAAPTFADCAFANGVTVDCSAAATAGTRPKTDLVLAIARYTGTAPDVSSWELTGTGVKRLHATLTAADGEVRLHIPPRKGVVMFVR